MGAPCRHPTSQPSRLGGSVSQVAEVRRPAPCPGAPPASTWTRSSMALRPSPPLPHSSASRSLGPSPHPHDPLVTPLLWLGVLACLCNSLRGAPTSPHLTALPLRMASACLEGSSRGGLPCTLTPAAVRGLGCPLLSVVLSPGLVVLGLSPPRVPRPQCTASLRGSRGAS